jgi:hypothetical protein
MWAIVQETDLIWYLDATGNILNKVKRQKAPFLYSLVFHDKRKHLILPIAEFVTTANDSGSISSYLSIIKLELERTIPKNLSFQIAPIIVTDFSWALINSVMQVFNNVEADVYINWCFEILFKKQDSVIILSIMKTRLHLCGAHFLKLIVKKVRKIKKYSNEEKDKKVQNAFIFTFTLLQNSITVSEFSKNLKHAFNIFNLKFLTEKCSNSMSEVKKELLERDLTIITLNDTKSNTPQQQKVRKNSNFVILGDDFDEKAFQKNSPFNIYYDKLINNHSKNIKFKESVFSDKIVLNDYFCPQMFNIISNYFHIIPFWTGVMLGQMASINTKFNNISRLTNNSVENWFNQVKTSMNPDRPIMPSIYASRMLNRIDAEFEKHYSENNFKLNKGRHSSKATEKWSKADSKKRPRYGNGYYGAPNKKIFDNSKPSFFPDKIQQMNFLLDNNIELDSESSGIFHVYLIVKFRYEQFNY